MNSNKWIRENSILSIVIGIVLIALFIYFAFGGKTTATTSSDSRESSFFSSSDESFSTEGQAVISDVSPEEINPANVAISQKPYRWCVMFNDNGNMHVPDLFGQGVPNKYGGADWHDMATSDGKGQQGIINEDGSLIFFIKKAYLTQNGLTEISSALMKSELNWKGVPMSWANVAGEPALIAVIK